MEKNLNIIHIVLGKGNPNRMNGVNKVAYYLAQAQQALGYHVMLFGITPRPNEPADYEHNYELTIFKAHTFPFSVDKKLKKTLLGAEKPLFVHLHGGFIPEFVTISSYLKKRGIPFLITSHGAYNLVAMKTNRLTKKWYFPLLEKKIVKRAFAVHLIGKSEKQGLKLLHTQVKTVVIPNGQKIGGNYPVHKSTHGKIVFGFLGRIDIHTKGLDIIVNAVRQLEMELRQKILVKIVGSGKENDRLKKMIAKSGLERFFELTGPRYGDEKWNEIATFDVFLHPSRNEGMPGAVLEAAVQKVPCIVSKETNIGNYIQQHNAGMVLPENNATALSKAMEAMIKAKKEHRLTVMGENAHTMIQTIFTWEKIAKEMIKVYKTAF